MTTTHHLSRRRALTLGLAAPLAIWLAGCEGGNAKAAFHSTDITGASLGQDLNLTDHQGKPRTLADFKGKVVVVFFGFIQCPDVCPTALAELAQVMRNLGPQAEQVQVLFVTVDPERDTQEVLSQYVSQFDSRFLGLRGDLPATERTAKSFKAFYAKVPTQGDNYTMEHTAGLFIFDPQGQVRLFARYNAGVDALTSDVKQLLV